MSSKRAVPGVRSGFTLVELMVVIVIIGLLASVVTVSVRGYMITSKQNIARLEIQKLCQALETFYTQFDRYPSNQEGLAILMQKTERFPDGILTKLPVDPWGRDYQYNHPGKNGPYDVISLGADGREGGRGADLDLSQNDSGRTREP